MPTFTTQHVLTTEDRLTKEFDSALEEAVKAAYYEAFVGERSGEGRKDRLEWLLATAGIEKLDKGSMAFENLSTVAHEIVHEDFGKGLIISRNQFEDDEFGFAGDWSAHQGSSVALLPQDLAVAAIKANIVGYDALAFFHNAHPKNPLVGASGGTYSNVRTSAALTLDNFAAAEAQMAAYTFPNGKSRALKAKHLIVPPALRKTALEITGAKQINATENVIATNYGVDVIVAPDLGLAAGGSDTTWYISTDMPGTTGMGKPWIYSLRRAFEFSSFDGMTQVELARRNELEWHVRGRATLAAGHPFLMIRCTA